MADLYMTAAFDSGSTITGCNTPGESIKFTHSFAARVWKYFFPLSVLLCRKAGIAGNNKTEEIAIGVFYKRRHTGFSDRKCTEFHTVIEKQVCSAAKQTTDERLRAGTKVIIISASPKKRILPRTHENGTHTVAATRLKTDCTGKLRDRFPIPNCSGIEKKNRFMLPYSDRTEYTLPAYGDSSGDYEFLTLADKSYYRIS